MDSNSPQNPIAPTRNRKRNNLPSKNQKWTPEEDARLHQIASQVSVNWKATESQFPGKTAQQIFERWTKVLDPKLMKGSWTRQEDEIIIDFVAKNGCKSWTKLSASLPGKIGKQCRERWINHLNPNINKDPWTDEEDKKLYELHEIYGNHWSKISHIMGSRTDNMVKNRWYSVLSKRPPSEKKSVENVEPKMNIVQAEEIPPKKEVEKDISFPKPLFDDDSKTPWSLLNTPFQGTPSIGLISPLIVASPLGIFSPYSKMGVFSPWGNETPIKAAFQSPTKSKNSPPTLTENRAEFMNLCIHP